MLQTSLDSLGHQHVSTSMSYGVLFVSSRFSVRLCVWLDYFEIPAVTSCYSSNTYSCEWLVAVFFSLLLMVNNRMLFCLSLFYVLGSSWWNKLWDGSWCCYYWQTNRWVCSFLLCCMHWLNGTEILQFHLMLHCYFRLINRRSMVFVVQLENEQLLGFLWTCSYF